MSTTAVESGGRSETKERREDDVAVSRAKGRAILDACSRDDIQRLEELAVSKGGFLSDAIRFRAWAVLLGFAPHEVASGNDGFSSASRSEDDGSVDEKSEEVVGVDKSWTTLPRHRDEDQVRLDVDRSFIYYPNDESKSQLDTKKAELSDLITETLREQPYLCYFQGYHDICQVFLLVLPPQLRASAVARLSVLRIRDFMLPTLAPAISQLRLIPDILNAVDPALCRHLSQTEPFFALSGTLTMYAHDIQSYNSIARLFDALLAREQIFSVYMFAQIVLNRREELFDTPDSEPEMLHSILSKLPQPLDLDKLIADTAVLFKKHPPESLRSWRSISSASVLKTARDVTVCSKQSLEDGYRFFDKQLKEMKWAESRERILKQMWAYRKPARGIALAVLIGLAAVYVRKSPSTWGLFEALWAKLR